MPVTVKRPQPVNAVRVSCDYNSRDFAELQDDGDNNGFALTMQCGSCYHIVRIAWADSIEFFTACLEMAKQQAAK